MPIKLNLTSLLVIVFLLGLTLLLHHSALDGYWHSDDGFHLQFAATYSPWQYFFVPDITRLQSSANLTPWNALFYDFNLGIFGLEPWGFYLHQLLLLMAIAFASYVLLRVWIQPVWALLGASLFLIGTPTHLLAHQLMTGHYLTGLLFSLISVYFFVLAVRRQQWTWNLVGVGSYLLAVTCKEIYVPLLLILPLLPIGEWKTRIRFTLPFVAVASFYVLWRYLVLHRFLGGYQTAGGYDYELILETFGRFPWMLLGDNWLGVGALLGGIGLLSYMLFRHWRQLGLFCVMACAVLLPLVPLVSFPGITMPDRYLFLLWWSISVAIAVAAATATHTRLGQGIVAVFILVLLLATYTQSTKEKANYLIAADQQEQQTRFIVNSTSDQIFLATTEISRSLPAILAAEAQLVTPPPARARIMVDMAQLQEVDLTHFKVWHYEIDCACVTEITETIPAQLEKYNAQLVEKPLSIRIEVSERSVSWSFGPYETGQYALISETWGFMPLPPSQKVAYPGIPISGYIRYQSPEGWMTQSPSFLLSVETNSILEWERPQ